MNIIILYNPNSTGNSKQNALDLAKQLRTAKDSSLTVNVKATTHAGHAEEIAARHAKTGKQILLVSSSGDGGYHELINGALSQKSSRVITGLLPSGNANDHHSAVGSSEIADDIVAKNFRKVDTIQVSGTIHGRAWTRYAHSYAGIGVGAKAARDITDARPNVVTEKWLVMRSLFSLHPVRIIESGKSRHYSSLIFSNIPQMSKVIKLSKDTSVTDGKFEVNGIRFRSKLRLIAYLLRATTTGLKQYRSTTSYTFTTTKPLLVQLDGETYTLDAHTKVTVRGIKQNLRCVV